MEEKYVDKKLDDLKDEIRDIKLNYIKKDDLDYRMMIEKTQKHSEKITGLETEFKNFRNILDKNNALTESISTQNVRLTTLLENISYQIDTVNKTSKENNEELSKEVKDLNEKVNKIDIETSKNTDNRLSNKQIVLFIITIFISAIVGSVLGVPVK